MGKFHIGTPILQGNALFSGKIYTIGNIFILPPVLTVATNFKSVGELSKGGNLAPGKEVGS